MADDVDVEGASDTAHLYEGKKVRSSAPSRRTVSYTHLTLPTILLV